MNKKAKSYFFRNVKNVLTLNDDDVKAFFYQVETEIENGEQCYSILPYELGYYLDDYFRSIQIKTEILSSLKKYLCFYFFDESEIIKIDSDEIDFSDFSVNKSRVKNFNLSQNESKYFDNIQSIKSHISEGDTYQVNYTIKGRFSYSQTPSDLFKKLIFNQSADFSAFINLGNIFLVSLSPELFFTIENGIISSRPMKGTIGRGISKTEDQKNYELLINSEKDKAENLMIVDLIRNDLGNIGETGSVVVKKLFEIEKYESLYQMTSSISSRIKHNLKFSEILKAIFPCGSITGAPKFRTMEIIKNLEKNTRGIYTGSIGFHLKDYTVYNVAIRTIEIDNETKNCEVGLGSGIVWDSNPKSEYNEVKLKASFLLDQVNYFELIETMLVVNNNIDLIDLHLVRLAGASNYFLFRFDELNIRNTIRNYLVKLDYLKNYKMKLLLSKWGEVKIFAEEIINNYNDVSVSISSTKINSQNRFQYFKTTNRKLYDDVFKMKKHRNDFDIIFINERDELCEGARSNIFLKKGEKYFTPPIDSGILNGIGREVFINSNDVIETKLYSIDLFKAEEILLTNSVRGVIRVNLLKDKDKKKRFDII
ncbi:MAG: aminodeoxychorismate synthase component I [Ignavibacteria bacterium]|nr:aminodeoxychorismate synthase component I [Ignavibacteria bacterium]